MMIKQFDLAITDLERFACVKAVSKLRLRQSEIIHHTQTQNLTWDIIYIVGVGMFGERAVFATDVCNAVKASKSSTIKAINRLVKDKVIIQDRDNSDWRRKTISFTKSFKEQFTSLTDEFIREAMIKAGDDFLKKDNDLKKDQILKGI